MSGQANYTLWLIGLFCGHMIKNNSNNSLKIFDFLRSEISFWLVIISIIVGGVIAFQKLDARVLASETKIQVDNTLLLEIDKKVDTLLINQAETQKDVQYLINNR